MKYSATFHMDFWLWFGWVAASVGAGLLFGLALAFPFARVRYAWSRLLIAALVSAPVVQWWVLWGYLLPRRHHMGGWFVSTADWFGHVGTQAALPVLTGVAIASGLVASDRVRAMRPESPPADTSAPSGS